MGDETHSNDPVTGVFLFSKEVKNDGQIVSEGKKPVTHIETEKYSGKGLIKSKQMGSTIEKWHQTCWGKVAIGLFITVTSGLIVFLITKK